jgi:hypothetical protein
MELVIDQRFRGATLAQFVELYFSDEFNDAICPAVGVRSRTLLLRQSQPDGTLQLRTRVVPCVHLPPPLCHWAGRLPIEYQEVSRYDPQRYRLDYAIEHAAQHVLEVKGCIDFAAVPDGVRQRIQVGVTVRLPAVRPLVERIIADELRRAFGRKAELMQQRFDRTETAAREQRCGCR